MVTLRQIKSLFTKELWEMDTEGSSKHWRRIVRLVKLARITIKTFFENKMGFQCVALSYFITLAIVPFCALIFAITGGLGISDKVEELLYNVLPTNPEMIQFLLDKADNILNTAKSGGVGIISALVFLWTIIWMMFQVERVFNNVWGISKIPRKLYNRFGFYFLVMFLSPFIILVFGTGIVFYTNMTNLIGLDLSDIKVIPELLGWIGFYILTAFTLTIMYKFIPAAKVRWAFAFRSALLTAVVFAAFQYLYLETQVFVARLDAVYGVIAAIPLFLIWLNLSWQIIIYGAGLTYSYHHVDDYNIPEWKTDRI